MYYVISKHLSSYDYLLFRKIDESKKVPYDDFRSTDRDFRKKVEEVIIKLLEENAELLRKNNVQIIEGTDFKAEDIYMEIYK